MRRICFVTCRTWREISDSDRLAQRALEARDATVEGRPWNTAGAGPLEPEQAVSARARAGRRAGRS